MTALCAMMSIVGKCIGHLNILTVLFFQANMLVNVQVAQSVPYTNVIKHKNINFIPSERSRIVNGHAAHISQAPWQVYIYIAGQQCGGSIIDPQFVVTAAHCFPSGARYVDKIYIIYGADHLQHYEATPAGVAQFLIHPQYTGINLGYDVALLMLKQKLTLVPGKVAVIPLADGPPPDRRLCKVSGYGKTSAGGETSKQLLMAYLEMVDQATCFNTWNLRAVQNGLIICGHSYDSKSICQGDSGGPSSCAHNGQFYLHGISSFVRAVNCMDPAFTNVPSVKAWIIQTIHSMKRQNNGPQGK